MKVIITIVMLTIITSGCSSIGAYSERPLDTRVSFLLQHTDTHNYQKKQTELKVAQTGLVAGSTLLYAASGTSPLLFDGHKHYDVVYPLWINESEVDEVEYAIDKYRQWQEQVVPKKFSKAQPINEYVSQWMNSVTFKFSLLSAKNGQPLLRVCYEFTDLGHCTFTYLLDSQSIEFLSDDLQVFKQHISVHDSGIYPYTKVLKTIN